MSSSALPPSLNRANRFAHIDGLRAAAVMVVVVSHAGLGFMVPGGSGVTIFFTISGFIITYLMLRERDRTGRFSIGWFYFRRAAKILPPYLLVIVVPSLIWAIWNPISWKALLAQIFFVFNWVKASGPAERLPGSGVVWSLSIEEQFYIVFALIWLLLVRRSWWRAGTFAVAAAAIVWSVTARLVLAAQPGTEDRIYYGSDTRIEGIAIGVLAAVLVHAVLDRGWAPRVVRLLGSDWALVAAVVLYLLSLAVRDEWFRSTFRFTLQGVATALAVMAPFMPGDGPLRRGFVSLSAWRPVALIGLASYSIYLVHYSVSDLMTALFVGQLHPILQVAINSVAATLAGIAVYLWVEQPVLRWRRRVESARR